MASDATPPPVGSKGLACKQCDYALQGLPDDSVCPECGLPIIASRGDADLALSPSDFLARVRRGISLVQAGSVAFAALLIAGIVASGVLGGSDLSRVVGIVITILSSASAAAVFLGWFHVASRDPANLYDRKTDKSRESLRTWSIAGAISSLVFTVAMFGLLPSHEDRQRFAGTFGKLGSVVSLAITFGSCALSLAPIVHFDAAMRFSRLLGVRARVDEVPLRTRHAMIGVGVVIAAVILSGLLKAAAGIDALAWLMVPACLVAIVLYARVPGPLDRALAAAQQRRAERDEGRHRGGAPL